MMSTTRGTRRAGFVAPIKTGDAKIDRAQDEVAGRINALTRGSFAQAVPLEVKLVEGLNKIGHRLGRPVSHFIHAALPTMGVFVASAQHENPFPSRQIWVRMTGLSEMTVLLFLFPTVG